MQSAIRVYPAVLLALISGCAGYSAPKIQTDTAAMAQVQRLATQRGVLVYWINPPQKRVAAPAS